MNLLKLGILFFSLQASAATIIYSNDGMGDLEPCGCRSNPQGGLVRKARLIETLGDNSVLQVDAGNFMFPTLELPDGLKEQYEVQAKYLLKALELSKQDVIVPGEKDFTLGLKKFKELTTKSKIHFLSANLKGKNGKLIFQPSHIFTLKTKDSKKIRVGVLGLSGRDLSFPKDLKVDDPVAAAKVWVPLLRKKSNIVIIVSNQGLEKDQLLAAKVKGIDHIFGGQTQSFLQVPVKVEGTSIYQSSFRNQYIGVLKLDLKKDDPNFHQLLGLDASFDAPKEETDENKKLISVRLVNLISEFKSAVAKINSEKSRLTHSGENLSSADREKNYHTFPKCSECHMKQFDFWRKTNHANALMPLLESKQIRNKECLTCHTLGQGEKGGYNELSQIVALHENIQKQQTVEVEDFSLFMKKVHQAKTLTEKVKLEKIPGDPWILKQSVSKLKHAYAPVQCENCHQAGANHPFDESYSKSVSNDRCLKCHTPERAPSWYKEGKLDQDLINKKRILVSCPAGELQEEGE